MAGPSEFTPVGPADRRRVRNSAISDFAVAFLLAVLAFPFPVVRQLLPIPVFVASIVGTVVVTHVLYLSVFAMAWGRTPTMFLLELGLSEKRLGVAHAFVWAATSSLGFWPLLLGFAAGDPETGLAARISDVRVVATR